MADVYPISMHHNNRMVWQTRWHGDLGDELLSQCGAPGITHPTVTVVYNPELGMHSSSSNSGNVDVESSKVQLNASSVARFFLNTLPKDQGPVAVVKLDL